jgi:hypothetical protein
MSPHIGTRRAHTWPRWALWALMSGAQRATSDIWKGRDGRSVAHLFDAPDRTPLQKAHHYRCFSKIQRSALKPPAGTADRGA